MALNISQNHCQRTRCEEKCNGNCTLYMWQEYYFDYDKIADFSINKKKLNSLASTSRIGVVSLRHKQNCINYIPLFYTLWVCANIVRISFPLVVLWALNRHVVQFGLTGWKPNRMNHSSCVVCSCKPCTQNGCISSLQSKILYIPLVMFRWLLIEHFNEEYQKHCCTFFGDLSMNELKFQTSNNKTDD